MSSHTSQPCPPGCFNCADNAVDNYHTTSLIALATTAARTFKSHAPKTDIWTNLKLRVSCYKKVESRFKFTSLVRKDDKYVPVTEKTQPRVHDTSTDLLIQEQEVAQVRALRRMNAETELLFAKMLAANEALAASRDGNGDIDIDPIWVQDFAELDITANEMLFSLVVEERLAWEHAAESE